MSKRLLSRTNPDKLRVCDKCDFDMDNEELKKNLTEIETMQRNKIEILNSYTESLHDNKEQLQMTQKAEQDRMEALLVEKNEKYDEFKCKLNKIRKEAQAQTNAKNSRHQSICDLEKVLGYFEIEQSRLKTKQKTLLAQVMEMEQELESRNLLTAEQEQQLDTLKQKIISENAN